MQLLVQLIVDAYKLFHDPNEVFYVLFLTLWIFGALSMPHQSYCVGPSRHEMLVGVICSTQ